MKMYAAGDKTIILGDWKAWEAACFAEKRLVPPEEFKALDYDTRRAYLKPIKFTTEQE